MQRRPLFLIFFISISAGLLFLSCGKKKSGASPVAPNPSDIPSDWDLNSDYPASDLKAKDL